MPEPDQLMRAGEEALRSAKVLCDHGLWADAISRAYYAMIYTARALLASKGLSPKTHRGAVQLLGREFVGAGNFPPELVKSLSAVMAFRDRADYGAREDLTEGDARRTLDAAGAFIDAADEILHGGQ